MSPQKPGRRQLLGHLSRAAAIAVCAPCAIGHASTDLNHGSRFMLDTVECQRFTEYLETPFRILSDDQWVEVRLAEANPCTGEHPPTAKRSPFSLVFQVPRGTKVEQGTFQVQHEGLGEFELFLVPVCPSDDGPMLEAVFN